MGGVMIGMAFVTIVVGHIGDRLGRCISLIGPSPFLASPLPPMGRRDNWRLHGFLAAWVFGASNATAVVADGYRSDRSLKIYGPDLPRNVRTLPDGAKLAERRLKRDFFRKMGQL
jgi:hypothetical protein